MKPVVIRAVDAPKFGVHGAEVVGYASPSRGSPDLCAWRVSLNPGISSPVHSLEVDEVFLVLRGEAVFEFDQDRVSLGEGDGLTVPKGTRFRIVCAEGGQAFEAAACVLAGGRARIEGGEPFVPAWAV